MAPCHVGPSQALSQYDGILLQSQQESLQSAKTESYIVLLDQGSNIRFLLIRSSSRVPA